MEHNISLDYKAIELDVAKITEATANISEATKSASLKVNDLKDDGGVSDVTIAVISGKLEESHKALKEIPEMLADLCRTLKVKSEDLENATEDACRSIEEA